MRGHVRIKDLLELIAKLLACRRKRTVHFGIDLYVILLCGQRFLADHNRIEEGIIKLIDENFEEKKPVLHFTMVIGKTNVHHEVCLNSQLYRLLIAFKWKGFHPKTYRLVKRMTEWLGIFGYSFKDSILTAVAEVASNLKISQDLAGHASIANTFRYTPLHRVKDIFAVVNRLVVPEIDSHFGKFDQKQLVEYLNSLQVDNVRYASFRQNWMPLLLSRLYTRNYQHDFDHDQRVDFMAPECPEPVQLLNSPAARPQEELDSLRVQQTLEIIQAERSSDEGGMEDVEDILT